MMPIKIIAFQKSSSNYDQISSYLEFNGIYLNNMRIFDEAWDLYLAHELKS